MSEPDWTPAGLAKVTGWSTADWEKAQAILSDYPDAWPHLAREITATWATPSELASMIKSCIDPCQPHCPECNVALRSDWENLGIAWRNLGHELAKALKLQQVLDWLEKQLRKVWK